MKAKKAIGMVPIKGLKNLRNTLQHPITKDEMIQTLEDLKADWLKEQSEKMIIGGIRGAVLNEIIKIVRDSDRA